MTQETRDTIMQRLIRIRDARARGYAYDKAQPEEDGLSIADLDDELIAKANELHVSGEQLDEMEAVLYGA